MYIQQQPISPIRFGAQNEQEPLRIGHWVVKAEDGTYPIAKRAVERINQSPYRKHVDEVPLDVVLWIHKDQGQYIIETQNLKPENGALHLRKMTEDEMKSVLGSIIIGAANRYKRSQGQ